MLSHFKYSSSSHLYRVKAKYLIDRSHKRTSYEMNHQIDNSELFSNIIISYSLNEVSID